MVARGTGSGGEAGGVYEISCNSQDQQRMAPMEERKQAHRGSLIMILGFASFCLPFPLAPIAWLLGKHDLEEMRKGRMDSTGESATNTGRLCGKIACIGFLTLFGLSLCLDVAMLPFLPRMMDKLPPVKIEKSDPAEPAK